MSALYQHSVFATIGAVRIGALPYWLQPAGTQSRSGRRLSLPSRATVAGDPTILQAQLRPAVVAFDSEHKVAGLQTAAEEAIIADVPRPHWS